MSDIEIHGQAEKVPAPEQAATEPQLPFPGVYSELARLPAGAIINGEEALAKLLGKSVHTIQRAVKRGDLPAPAKMFGKPTWLAGAIIRHHERRMEQAEKNAEQLRRHAKAV